MLGRSRFSREDSNWPGVSYEEMRTTGPRPTDLCVNVAAQSECRGSRVISNVLHTRKTYYS